MGVARGIPWLVVLTGCGRLGFDGTSTTAAPFDAVDAPDAPPGFPMAGLVAHWPLDDLNGTFVADSTAAHPGTWLGEAALRPSTGVVGGALEFDGTDDYVEVPHHADFDVTDISITAWIYLDNNTSQKVILDKKFDGGANGYRFIAFWTTLRFTFSDGVTIQIHTFGPDSILEPGRWYHAAATYDRQNVRLYLDGVEVEAEPHTEPIENNTYGLRIANYQSDAYWFDGKVDDVRLYNRALLPAEVVTLHCSGLGTCP